MDRRTTIKWMLAASAALPLVEKHRPDVGRLGAGRLPRRRMATAPIPNSSPTGAGPATL